MTLSRQIARIGNRAATSFGVLRALVRSDRVAPAPHIVDGPSPFVDAANEPSGPPQPAEDAAPAGDPAPAEDAAPVEDSAPAEDAAPAEDPAPAEDAAPAPGGAPCTLDGGLGLHERLGLKLLLDVTSVVDRCVVEVGAWEEPQTTYFIGLVRDAVDRGEDPVFLDLGSYWGLYSLLAMRAGARRIHAFDADRHNFAQLQAQIFLNSASGIVTPHNRAVSSKAGVLHCWDSRTHPDGNRGGVGVVNPDAGLATYEVPSVAIDDELPMTGQTIFIKLDVEGHEDEALRGLRRTVADNRVTIQIEMFEEHRARVMPVVESLGLRKIHEIAPDVYFTNLPAVERHDDRDPGHLGDLPDAGRGFPSSGGSAIEPTGPEGAPETRRRTT